MSKNTNTLISFLVGAATGAALGILYAPDKGSNTRDRLSFQLDKTRKQLTKFIEDLRKHKESLPNAARSEGEKVINDAKVKAERLLSDVDDLIGQIKKND
ncbi:MAG TPA: gas vesicle protein [Cytophagales bacterium]|nr:gas vesicle protein [Cytophagales bacterium]HAA21502.1 gas vesicle protein [Cytophagales bacterium]HAP64635.1 gas vesicle protein [Cytophagales bacterium]